MNYFEEEYLIIKTEESIAIMEWLGLAKTDSYRTGFNTFLNLLQEGKQVLWLFDYTYGKVIDMNDQKWTSEEWFPSAIEILEDNLKKVAVISSTDIFNKVAVRLIMNGIMMNSEAEVAFFESKEEAMDWLVSYEPETETETEVAEGV